VLARRRVYEHQSGTVGRHLTAYPICHALLCQIHEPLHRLPYLVHLTIRSTAGLMDRCNKMRIRDQQLEIKLTMRLVFQNS
jgi:hypothetical protein